MSIIISIQPNADHKSLDLNKHGRAARANQLHVIPINFAASFTSERGDLTDLYPSRTPGIVMGTVR